MSTSQTTLSSLWPDDGSPVKAPPASTITTTTPLVRGANAELKDDVMKFYKDCGLESVAKEAGLIDANGDLTFKEQTQPPKQIQMVALPISASPGRTLQFSQPILPKTSHHGSAMVTQLNAAPQRLLNPITHQQLISGTAATSTHLIPVQIQPAPPGGSPQIIKKRPISGTDLDLESKKNRRSMVPGEKGGKGLRHFSMKVCEKVQRKGITSYNEVADELVTEFTDPRNVTPTDQQYDQKNIRRRVYDALNVLMAMNIISKEKKEIKWIGLPTNSAQECQNLEIEKQRKLERIRHKTQQLQELILQQIAFKNLVQRNSELEKRQGSPAANSAIQLPFIIVNTSKKTVIDCSISNDKYEYLFNFDNTFEIHDDIEVLKRMGMALSLEKGDCTPDDLKKAVRMIPRALEPYVKEMAANKGSKQLGIPTTASRPAQKEKSGSISQDPVDAEVAAVSSLMSRQSSTGSLTDPGVHVTTDTPSEMYSDSASDRSTPVDVS